MYTLNPNRAKADVVTFSCDKELFKQLNSSAYSKELTDLLTVKIVFIINGLELPTTNSTTTNYISKLLSPF